MPCRPVPYLVDPVSNPLIVGDGERERPVRTAERDSCPRRSACFAAFCNASRVEKYTAASRSAEAVDACGIDIDREAATCGPAP